MIAAPLRSAYRQSACLMRSAPIVAPDRGQRNGRAVAVGRSRPRSSRRSSRCLRCCTSMWAPGCSTRATIDRVPGACLPTLGKRPRLTAEVSSEESFHPVAGTNRLLGVWTQEASRCCRSEESIHSEVSQWWAEAASSKAAPPARESCHCSRHYSCHVSSSLPSRRGLLHKEISSHALSSPCLHTVPGKPAPLSAFSDGHSPERELAGSVMKANSQQIVPAAPRRKSADRAGAQKSAEPCRHRASSTLAACLRRAR